MALIFDAEIRVHSVIDNLNDAGLPEGDPEINIYTVDGFLRDNGENLNINYVEKSESGKTFCDITVLPECVLLKRRGESESDMEFREGASFSTIYGVPPYKFDMVYRTKKIRSTMERHGGELQLIYSMTIGGQAKNVRMKITVKTK